MNSPPRNTILVGDALQQLRALPTSSVDCVVTSPPYFQLRSYGVDGQYGHEANIDEWVSTLREVCRELYRVLVPTGSFWLNVADSYSRHHRYGAPPKSLLLGPERLALALAADGWTLRNRVVWAKPNPMPSSVRDRLSCTWEQLYLFTKQASYHFDLDAIRIPHRTTPTTTSATPRTVTPYLPNEWRAALGHNNNGLSKLKHAGRAGHPHGKNPGDVWTIATAGFRGAHFATFPARLIERPIRASCPHRRCQRCRLPLAAKLGRTALKGAGCGCNAGTEPGIVLDPFMGAGTVGVAATRQGRDWLGIELNPTFAAMAHKRIRSEQHTRRHPSNQPQPSNTKPKGGDHV
jgi:site-specific DNA-methyltransferase (adenine-specific)